MASVADRIARGVKHYEGTGDTPIRIELTTADHDALTAEFEAASGDLQKLFVGWPDRAFGLTIFKVEGQNSAVVASIPNVAGRTSFVI